MADSANNQEGKRQLPLRQTVDGWHILRVSWQAIPGYNYEEASRGMSAEDRRRELDLDWFATSGVLVYPMFNPDLHIAKEPIPYDPHESLYLGWDPGLTPAFVVSQISSYGQFLILSAIAPEQGSGLGTYEFAEMCAEHLQREYALPHGRDLKDLRMVHFGDPAGAQPPMRTGQNAIEKDVKSHFAIIRDGVMVPAGVDDRGETMWEKRPGFGWHIRPSEKSIAKRLEAMRARLSLLVNGQPALLVSPSCVEVIQALSSHHYKIRVDGRQELDPHKGWASHVADCCAYICARLWTSLDADDEDAPQPPGFWSVAAGPRDRY